MFNIKDIVKKQTTQTVNKGFNQDLFTADREVIEFSKSDYDSIHLVNTDTGEDRMQGQWLTESVVALCDNDMYLITAKTTAYQGNKQVHYTQQPLTLKGFNYFTKDVEEDFEEFYHNYLKAQGYDITLEDILTTGELSTEYGSTTLKFTDDEETQHYITVNQRGQLSSITKKRVQQKMGTLTSAF